MSMRGRKNLKQAASEQDFTLEECQSIAQVVSIRGSNQIEIVDAKGENSLALFPGKFRDSMWIRRGSFVVIDHTGKEKAQESGSKVTSIVCKVLLFEQVRLLQKSSQWPEIFRDVKLVPVDESSEKLVEKREEKDGEIDSSDEDDDGMPPLEENTNRLRMFGMQQRGPEKDSESDSGSESDS